LSIPSSHQAAVHCKRCMLLLYNIERRFCVYGDAL